MAAAMVLELPFGRTPAGHGKKYRWLQTPKGKAYIKRHNRNVARRQADYRERQGEQYRKAHREYERWRRSTPEGKRRKKDIALRKAHGVTLLQFEEMARRQGGRCAICVVLLDMGKGTHIDHDHNTGKIRGVLCSPCNTALGSFRDDPDLMLRAIQYLKEDKPCP